MKFRCTVYTQHSYTENLAHPLGWTQRRTFNPKPFSKVARSFYPGDTTPVAFPGCVAVEEPAWPRPVHSANQALEDFQSEIGTAGFIQLIASSRHGF